jgi:hypothetical protein
MRSEGVFLDAQRFQVNTKLNAEEFGNSDHAAASPTAAADSAVD